jgi:hypothetical protein
LNKNCYFGNYNRAAFFEERSPCYELRVLGQDDLLESFIFREKSNDDGKFDAEALTPDGQGKYKLGEWPK